MAKKKAKKKAKKRGYVTVAIQLKKEPVKVYASPLVGQALRDVVQDMTLYKGVKLFQVLEAVYQQGKKDGARAAFQSIDLQIHEAKKIVPHKNPGRPRKRKT